MALREISTLQALGSTNKNICALKEVVSSCDGQVSLILEYCEFDLRRIIGKSLSIRQTKSFMQQLLDGLAFVHDSGFLHRDLKPENVLVTKNNVLKITDFGLSRQRLAAGAGGGHMGLKACSVWYRPPEMFLGNSSYDYEIDIWSAGCIFYELLTGKILFRGRSEESQLHAILEVRGRGSTDQDNDSFAEFLEKTLPEKYLEAKDLLLSMLEWVPKARTTAREALQDVFFAHEAEDLDPDSIPMLYLGENGEERKCRLLHRLKKPLGFKPDMAVPHMCG
jgi:cyclin-dependent kinase 12/13